MKSSLTDVTILNNHYSSRNGTKIDKITIHHMAGNLSVETCGNVFKTREASANYGIGSDGRVGCYVLEENRAWSTANPSNDRRAINIEVANDVIGGDWHVSDTALEKCIELCVDICKRHGISRLNYTGGTDGNLTRHNMFMATTCPGPYLQSKFPYIADEVNRRLGEQPQPAPTPEPDYTGTITYQSFNGAWQPEVSKCDDTPDGYAGLKTIFLSGIRAKAQYGKIYIQSRNLNGSWNSEVSSDNYVAYSNNPNSYAGIENTPQDMIKIRSTKGYVNYRVLVLNPSTNKLEWLAWVDSRTTTGTESYAGVPGWKIFGIQMK